MNPQKVALISHCSRLTQTITKTLGDQVGLLTTDSPKNLPHHQLLLYHHAPPFSNCHEWLPQLKKENPQRPVVVIGSSVSSYNVAEAFRLGASDFIFEPLDADLLLNCLYRHQTGRESKPPKPWWKKWLPWLNASTNHSLALLPNGFAPAIQYPTELLPKPDLEVQFFGNLSLLFRGKRVQRMPGKKAKSLLAYLLYQHPKPVHRDILMEKFWGESTPGSARNCLNVTLHAIRKSFEEVAPNEDIITFDNECYRIREDLLVEKDIDLFDAYWKKGQKTEQTKNIQEATDTYHQAFAFYRGDLLEDLQYEDWADPVREKYRETWLVILDRLSVHFFEKGKYQVSKNLCQKMVEKDPCLEEVHRRIMDCYARMKMHDMAVRQFYKCRDALKKELNMNPGKATLDLFNSLREG